MLLVVPFTTTFYSIVKFDRGHLPSFLYVFFEVDTRRDVFRWFKPQRVNQINRMAFEVY